MSRRGPSDYAKEIAPETRDTLGRIRRMVVKVTSRVLWQVAGHRLLDNTVETRDAEVFSGVGFYARPAADGNPEAILVFPGGASNPVIAAMRDEKTRQAVFKIAGELAAGETAIFNASAVVILKVGGTVEIRSLDGTAVALARQSDLQALRDHVASLPVGGTGSAVVPAPSVGTGTTVLKGE